MVNALELFRLTGKTAIVTGATSGIGKVTAEYLASAGANLAVVSRHLDQSQTVAQELSATYGIHAQGFQCDVSQEDQVEQLLPEIQKSLGVPDVLINNAGININGSAVDVAFSDWKRVMDVNVDGVFLMARGVARQMIEAGKPGSIVNIASISASIVNLPQCQVAYNTSKAAVLHMTKTMAVELVPHSIRVNAVSPGYMWTEMNQVVDKNIRDFWVNATPFQRFGKPEELAGAILYFASDASTFTSGSELLVDGCFTAI